MVQVEHCFFLYYRHGREPEDFQILFHRPCSMESRGQPEALPHCVPQHHKAGSVHRRVAELEHVSANLYFVMCASADLMIGSVRLFQDLYLRLPKRQKPLMLCAKYRSVFRTFQQKTKNCLLLNLGTLVGDQV